MLVEDPKTLGISFKLDEVIPLGIAHVFVERLICNKEVRQCILTSVAEGRITEIVCEGGGSDDGTKIKKRKIRLQLGMPL